MNERDICFEKIHDELLKVMGVNSVHVDEVVHVTTEMDDNDFWDEKTRNRVYEKEIELMDKYPNIHFDFHVKIEKGEKKNEGICSGGAGQPEE